MTPTDPCPGRHGWRWPHRWLPALCALTSACLFFDTWDGDDERPCGNGEHNDGEECDDGVHNSDTLPGACRTDCRRAGCGDGTIDPDEGCDRGQPAPPRCETFGFTAGVATCTRRCRLDLWGCTRCGDGRAEGADPRQRGYEACDGGDLRGATCGALGLGAGALACTADCTYDVSGCAAPSVCGDGVAAAPEACDDGDGQSHDGCSATCRWEAPRLTDLEPMGVPEHLLGGAMVYDAARGRVVVLSYGLHWEYDGIAWARRSLPVVPEVTSEAGLAYDAERDRLVLFTAAEEDGVAVAATWEFDGQTWTRRHPLHQPVARISHGLVYDAARGAVVLFGGYGTPPGAGDGAQPTVLGDTWTFDGEDWVALTTGASPSPRLRPLLAHDVARQRVVLVGGRAGYFGDDLTDTWELQGDRWTETTPTSSPMAWSRDRAALAYDPRRGRTVLFTTDWAPLLLVGQVWEYDGARWVETSPPGGLAAANWLGSAVYDPVGQGILLLTDRGTRLFRYRWE